LKNKESSYDGGGEPRGCPLKEIGPGTVSLVDEGWWIFSIPTKAMTMTNNLLRVTVETVKKWRSEEVLLRPWDWGRTIEATS